MQFNKGKVFYSTYIEANKIAEKLRKTHHEAFTAYRTNEGWCVGGNHTKRSSKTKKVNSLQDVGCLFYDFKLDEDDLSVDDYLNDIASELNKNKKSIENGLDNSWILKDVKFMTGSQLDMKNEKRYLALIVDNLIEKKLIRMGGPFERNIDLLYRFALTLKDTEIIWHTWNNSNSPGKWNSDTWFYKIEPKIKFA